jgi:hypothetical protein
MSEWIEQGGIQTLSEVSLTSSWVAQTRNVRAEYKRCEAQAMVRWQVAPSEVLLMWVQDRQCNQRITIAGFPTDGMTAGNSNFWFIPAGVAADGELCGQTAYSCVTVFIEPDFLPEAARTMLTRPFVVFSHDALGRAFTKLVAEMTDPDDVLGLFTEGWVIQALAYVARAEKAQRLCQEGSCSGLAPWQLRRAKMMLRANLTDTRPVSEVAHACKLSPSPSYSAHSSDSETTIVQHIELTHRSGVANHRFT